MAKIYLHIDLSDLSTFGKTTKLLYIDDEDPDIILYYFTDGTKCAEPYIANIDNPDAGLGQYVMIEVSSETNIWKFNKREVFSELKTATYIDPHTGNTLNFNIPDPYFIDMNGNRLHNLSTDVESGLGAGLVTEGIKYEAIAPRKSVIPVEDIKEYCLSYINYAKLNNIPLKYNINDSTKNNSSTIKKEEEFNIRVVNTAGTSVNINDNDKNIDKNVSSSSIPAKIEEPVQNIVTTSKITSTNLYIDLNELEKTDSNIEFDYNNTHYSFNTAEFIDKITYVKPIEEAPKKFDMYSNDNISLDDNNIKIDIINTPEWGLVNNMINMSNKDICTIDMELELSLPPLEVYKLIKTVYPEGMSDAFVKTIANRMSVKDLKKALAFGLLNYYDLPIQKTLEKNIEHANLEAELDGVIAKLHLNNINEKNLEENTNINNISNTSKRGRKRKSIDDKK